MALCVIIGQPYYLLTDPFWKEYIEYCDSIGCYTGMHCELLLRHRKEKQDEDDLLNAIALASLMYDEEELESDCLGSGFSITTTGGSDSRGFAGEKRNRVRRSQFDGYNHCEDSVWRVML